jgi:23S rRNA (guanine745-N1)-methyltransferase
VTADGTTPGAGAGAPGRRPRFRCPACREPFAPADAGLSCANGHRVDRAREGYVNLLPTAGRRPPGDDAAAVRARRALFDRGHYEPVARAVAAAVAAVRPGAVLDAGCGEGSYLAAVTAATGAEGWGVDVSKPAVRLAARRHREHRYAVASSRDLPFEDAVFDAVVSVFAPRAFAEFSRVLRPSGVIVLASPGPEHLDAVRALLRRGARSADVRRHVAGDGVPAPLAREHVRYDLALTSRDEVSDLVAMTPWQAFAEPGGPIETLPDALTTPVDVWVTTHAPHASG